jgi:hypothetical protein
MTIGQALTLDPKSLLDSLSPCGEIGLMLIISDVDAQRLADRCAVDAGITRYLLAEDVRERSHAVRDG